MNEVHAMRYDHIRRARVAKVAARRFPVIGVLLAVGAPISAWAQNSTQVCPSGDSGITVPPGFCATVFADDIGHARHLVVAPNGAERRERAHLRDVLPDTFKYWWRYLLFVASAHPPNVAGFAELVLGGLAGARRQGCSTLSSWNG